MKREEKYYLVRDEILPEAILKTVDAKKLLDSGEALTVNEAVEKVGLSRSAYYKYKDGVFLFNAMSREVIVTIAATLEHRSGVLSKFLSFVARQGGNVLTINQTIPVQGMAHVSMSIDTAFMNLTTAEFIEKLGNLDGVTKAVIVGRG
ncbi:ACT domain-containing protein [Ammoniphilus oxalaticus]|uniref:UPF0735 ACT domain-containing protein BEP19_05640 n=1 Tax=Ammoniphilus oxalaticus TaxID=66863 RepID=A0A419SIY4_9BACL|nr:ACT domain-containing protein [Ammoniphilus oxalaticus]RKD23909.1 ACT domain-containing protein [Ammoniphilus oxalaticus]